jgi:hypothetical protein
VSLAIAKLEKLKPRRIEIGMSENPFLPMMQLLLNLVKTYCNCSPCGKLILHFNIFLS